MRRSVIEFKCDICGSLFHVVLNPFRSKEEYPKGWVHVDCHYTTEGKYISHCASGQWEAEQKNKDMTRKKYLDICPACWCNKVPQWLDPGITPNERYGKEGL
jgi:hypothetical protein